MIGRLLSVVLRVERGGRARRWSSNLLHTSSAQNDRRVELCKIHSGTHAPANPIKSIQHLDRHSPRIPHRQLHLPIPPIPIQAPHHQPHIIAPHPVSPPPFSKLPLHPPFSFKSITTCLTTESPTPTSSHPSHVVISTSFAKLPSGSRGGRIEVLSRVCGSRVRRSGLCRWDRGSDRLWSGGREQGERSWMRRPDRMRMSRLR